MQIQKKKSHCVVCPNPAIVVFGILARENIDVLKDLIRFAKVQSYPWNKQTNKSKIPFYKKKPIPGFS